MSDESTPPPEPTPLPAAPPAASPPPEPRSGCMTAFMVIAGVVLLLPGMCFLAFAGQGAPLVLIGLVLIGGAIFLFIRAFMPPRPQGPTP